jgi:hypothetical protein
MSAMNVVERQSPRYRCRAMGELLVSGAKRLGLVSNVSEGGAFVFMDRPPEIGAFVELAVLTIQGEIFRGSGRVVRANGIGVAVAFDAPAPWLPELVMNATPFNPS